MLDVNGSREIVRRPAATCRRIFGLAIEDDTGVLQLQGVNSRLTALGQPSEAASRGSPYDPGRLTHGL